MSVLLHRRKAFRAAGGGFDKTDLALWCDFANSLTDQSGNHTVSAGGSPGYTTGPFSDANGAIRFTNTPDAYCTVPDAANLTPSGDLTFVAWLYPVSSANNYFFAKYNPSGQRSYYIKHDWTQKRLNTYRTDDGTTMEGETSANNLYPQTAWTHAAIVYTHSSNLLTYYADGSADATTRTYTSETGTLHDGTSTLYIGSLNGSDSAIMDCARLSFWGRALSAAEISDLYNGGSDKKYADL